MNLPGNTLQPEEDGNFDAQRGYFFARKPPKGFEDFYILKIITRDYDNDKPNGVPISPKGSLKMKKQFEFSARPSEQLK